MRELTVCELQCVSGHGISSEEAGLVLAGYGAAIVGGAAVGALMGPGGMLLGALAGASRVAIAGWITSLLLGTFKLY